jgi:hypothetical protein
MADNRSARSSLRHWLVFGLGAAVFVFFSGWALYHGFKRDLCELVMRQTRGTSYQHRGFTWAIQRRGNPIDRDLAGGAIRPGDSVVGVLARHPPLRTEARGPYELLKYYPEGSFGGGTIVIGKDGRVVTAAISSCVFFHVYFDTLSEAEKLKLSDLNDAAFEAQMAARQAAWMAVAGPAATIEPWNLPQPATEPGN